MTKFNGSSLSLCLVLLAMSLGGSALLHAIAQDLPTNNLKVINKTHSLEVIRMVRDKRLLHLTFRNNYTQPVIGLAVSPQKGTTDWVYFSTRREMIEAGATHEEDFLLFTDKETRDIIVLAALLEDCTIDGDPETAKAELAERRGERSQSEKLLTILTKYLNVPNFEAKTLNSIENDVAGLAKKTAMAEGDEGHVRRVSTSTFVLAKIRDLQQARKKLTIVEIKNELIRLTNILEAKRSSC